MRRRIQPVTLRIVFFAASSGDASVPGAFTPGGTCPITRLYWAFLARHEPTLRANPRLKLVMGSLRRRSSDDRERDREAFVHVRDVLVRGERLQPAAAVRRGR